MSKQLAKRKLNEKQDRFCKEYLIDLNATQAAIRAGYSAKTSGQMGFVLLKKAEIQDRLEILRHQRAKSTEISAIWVLERLKKIVEADPRKAFGPDGRALLPTELPDELAIAIAGIEVGDTTKIRLVDRLKALELIGKHIGMFVDRVQAQIVSQSTVQIYIPDNGRAAHVVDVVATEAGQ
jgi:phage terminase small subunit